MIGMTLHVVTVTPIAPTIFGGGPHRIDCTCGEHVTYEGTAFTAVEADRHRRWHEKAGK